MLFVCCTRSYFVAGKFCVGEGSNACSKPCNWDTHSYLLEYWIIHLVWQPQISKDQHIYCQYLIVLIALPYAMVVPFLIGVLHKSAVSNLNSVSRLACLMNNFGVRSFDLQVKKKLIVLCCFGSEYTLQWVKYEDFILATQ